MVSGRIVIQTQPRWNERWRYDLLWGLPGGYAVQKIVDADGQIASWRKSGFPVRSLPSEARGQVHFRPDHPRSPGRVVVETIGNELRRQIVLDGVSLGDPDGVRTGQRVRFGQ